jgi:hypothetical protein
MNADANGVVGITQGYTDWIAGGSRVYIQAGDIHIDNGNSNGSNPTTRDITITINTNSGNKLALNRGATEVMSFVGNSSTVTFAGGLSIGAATTIAGSLTITGAGNDLTVPDNVNCTDLYATGNVWGIHAAADGSTKADTSFTFYAAATSGGAVTKLHTVTFKDGLITSWSAV